ncbi:GTP-binding protein [Chondromyces apiculatus DSM 436]|uniref:GTPase HflX n=2 Tax=Chondromyces apiculatus TaxID=51 RepID=A0A017SWW4_9BACT|nr:GTP-binding protein [Chondromyces apiculatus DSM 436]
MSKGSKRSISFHASHSPACAILLARQHPERSDTQVQVSLDELQNLLAGLGIRVAHTVVQRRAAAASSTVLGEGKQAEVAALLAEARREHGEESVLVVVDEALSPGKLRTLENALEVEVIDRTGVILRVFEQRARTQVAQLEVEMARLTYEAPRVREDASLGDREGGGGRGGRGHSNVELKKQRIRERVASLRRALDEQRAVEEKQRARRRDALRVALVGYTNAGKSSLMRALTGSDVLVEDKLFATLGTTVRALSPETAPRILLSDTVGFIRDLPHELVASFHSTLEEARDAGLLLFVADASDPAFRDQLRVTRETLDAVGASGVPSRVLLTKIDRVDASTRAALAAELPDAVQVCAHDPDDIRGLRDALVAFFAQRMTEETFVVPFGDGRLLGEIRAEARVVTETYTDEGVVLSVRALPEAIGRWKRALPEGPPIEAVADLVEAARRHGLQLTTVAGDFDRTGLDFLVVHARDEEGVPWIVRTPRRPEVFASSCVEARALRLVRPRLPVAVPDWRVHAREVIAYPRLDGTPAITVDPSSGYSWNIIAPGALPEAFLDSFADTLAALQAIPPEEAADAGVPTKTIAEARQALAKAMEATRGVLAPSEVMWTRWHRWLEDDALWPQHLALVHGDLHPGHLLLGADGRMQGVLDWTEAQVTDPSLDFAMFAGCFGREALDALLTRFERAGGKTWPRLAEHAAERWAAFPVLGAEWALRTNNTAVLEFTRAQLAATEATAAPTQR